MPAANDVRAGGAFVELYAKSDALERGLDTAARRFKSFGSSLTMLGGAMVTAGTGIVSALIGAATHASNVGSALVDMSDRTGMSVESLSAFSYALGQSGSTMEEFENALKRMQKNLHSDESAKVFEELGFAIEELRVMDPHLQMVMLAEALGKIADPGEKAAAAMEVFGKSGTTLLPLFNNGADGLQKLLERAEELGVVMSAEDAKAAEEFGDSLETLQNISSRAITVIGSSMIPVFQGVADALVENTSAMAKWLSENRGAVLAYAGAAAALTALGVAVVTTGVALFSIGQICTVVAGTVAFMTKVVLANIIAYKAMVIALLTPGLPMVAIVLYGIARYMLLTGEAARKTGQSFKTHFAAAKEDVIGAIGAIQQALASGNLAAAANVGMSLVNLEFQRVINFMKEAWGNFVTDFKIGWIEAVSSIAQKMVEFQAQMAGWQNNAANFWDKFVTNRKKEFLEIQAAAGIITPEQMNNRKRELREEQVGREFGRADAMDLLGREKRAAIGDVVESAMAAQDKALEENNQKIAALTKEVEAARKELTDAEARAKMPPAAKPGGAGGPGGIDDPALGVKKLSAVGTFEGGLAERMLGGAGKVQEKQLEVQKKQKEDTGFIKLHTKLMVDYLDKLTDMPYLEYAP